MTSTSARPTVPRDGRLLALILASKGISDADDRVIHQLLDFAHRYTADVLGAAQQLADHAGRTGAQANRIEKEDVELAIQMRRRHEFVEQPPRDYLANLAHELNSVPLPPLPESFEVVRLPPASQRLTEVTFDLVPTDAAMVLSDDGMSESESESDSDADGEEDEPEVQDAEGEDDEMEEVVPGDAAPQREVEVDEDYDA
ncbi:hypothetical protein CspHIS471_0100660 [Cutaneotrichosporon sp. HIS471]|nr:hypothetical protein CspHIS471_0100660 [Cutaneotrichosporon sp. HIS471]